MTTKDSTADRNVRRALEGTVTSNAMAKTITVEVERTFKHAKYGKFVRKAKRFHAHDESGEARKGDRVEIMACRPISKTKRWRLVRILEKSRLVEAVQFDVEGAVADPNAVKPARGEGKSAQGEGKSAPAAAKGGGA
jgi:small subunit ribosomal protein S17